RRFHETRAGVEKTTTTLETPTCSTISVASAVPPLSTRRVSAPLLMSTAQQSLRRDCGVTKVDQTVVVSTDDINWITLPDAGDIKSALGASPDQSTEEIRLVG
ncbi:hypothetical protein SPRG_21240, partial [Saprolegnia parasitica CBS 223.65]